MNCLAKFVLILKQFIGIPWNPKYLELDGGLQMRDMQGAGEFELLPAYEAEIGARFRSPRGYWELLTYYDFIKIV